MKWPILSNIGWNLGENYDLNILASDFPQLEVLLFGCSSPHNEVRICESNIDL